jgi:hypothetical protein
VLSIPWVTVPDTFTWTMEFAGISQANGGVTGDGEP